MWLENPALGPDQKIEENNVRRIRALKLSGWKETDAPEEKPRPARRVAEQAEYVPKTKERPESEDAPYVPKTKDREASAPTPYVPKPRTAERIAQRELKEKAQREEAAKLIEEAQKAAKKAEAAAKRKAAAKSKKSSSKKES